MNDLKQRTLRGGLAKIITQAANLLVRMGSLMVLARLLDPKDFGLVAMVTAITAVFSVFRDFGLSSAAVQRSSISSEQSSTLFWINLLVGVILSLLILAAAPFIVSFYHDHRLFGVTAVLATGFLFNAAGVQHSALLERQMRFTTLAVIDICALLISTTIGISMATLGFGYWALVASQTSTPLIYTTGYWLTTKWVPGRPHKGVGMRSMMHFGATVTLNSLVMYVANNLDKVLLGRFWGASTLGIYGRAYQLINIPVDGLNSAAGGVAFAGLSRVQDEPSRLKNYFLKGYSLILSLTVPVTFTCALFANDMIHVFLGQKWMSAAVIFQFLAPSALGFAILNPVGWLIMSLGMAGRSLRMSFVLGPLWVFAIAIGMSHGPIGVAFAISAVRLLSAIPFVMWGIHGTSVHVRDILLSISRPLLSGIVGAVVAFGVQFLYFDLLSPLARLAVGVTVFFSVYIPMLFYAMGQKELYIDLIRGIMRRAPVEEVLEVSGKK